MELDWEYNDEFTCPEGEFLRSNTFLNEASTDAEYEWLCSEFFAAETPKELVVDLEGYHVANCGPSTVIRDELHAAGFPDPYIVQLVHAAEEVYPNRSNPVVHAERSTRKRSVSAGFTSTT